MGEGWVKEIPDVLMEFKIFPPSLFLSFPFFFCLHEVKQSLNRNVYGQQRKLVYFMDISFAIVCCFVTDFNFFFIPYLLSRTQFTIQ